MRASTPLRWRARGRASTPVHSPAGGRASTPPVARCGLLLLLAAGGLLLTTPLAHAAPTKTPGKRAHMSLEEVAVMLSSSSEDEVRTALETAAMLPARDIVPMLDERVRAGLSRELLDVAIDSLLLLNERSAGPLLIDLAHHRRSEVRVRALELITKLKTSNGELALRAALGDVSPDVRKAAAHALAESGAHDSQAQLIKALELGVDGSARALGKLAKSDELPRLLPYVSKFPLPTITPMVESVLARKDLSEADKLRALESVAAVGGEDALESLSGLLASLPAEAPARVRRFLTDAVQKGKNQ